MARITAGKIKQMLDRRRAKGACPDCTLTPGRKLCVHKAHNVRTLTEQGYAPKDIAPIYNISSSHVSNIGAGRRWPDA